MIAFLAAVAAAVSPAPAPASPITERDLRRHIEILASDEYEGRKPGTEGGNKTALYIATELQRAGLRPGASSASWYEMVALAERALAAQRNRWWMEAKGRSAARPLSVAEGDIILAGRDPSIAIADAPVVFVGHGLQIEGVRDDLAGVDLKGAIVLILPGRPDPMASVPSYNARRADLARRGAAAVLAVAGPRAPWEEMRAALAAPKIELVSADRAAVEGAIARPAIEALVRAAGLDLATIEDAARLPGFRAMRLGRASLDVTASVRRLDSPNVIGRIAGTDPAKGAVVYLAHWDHLGVCRPEGAADRICNGAVDNASGVAVMIEVARRMARGPKPVRDVYFVATTAEENGLLGARAFVASPPVPLAGIVGAINIDTVAIAPRTDMVAVIGKGMTPLDPLIEKVVGEAGRKLVPDDAVNELVQRQDGWVLMERGVSAVMVGGAYADPIPLAGFLGGPYHKPEDDLEREIVLDGAAQDGDLMLALGRALADPARYTPPAK